MRVTLVTTWDIPCGIAEYGYYWKEAVEGADPDIQVEVESNLHPDAVDHVRHPRALPDWIWLNFHAALHSQWTPAHVQRVQSWGVKVGITFHDSGVPNSDQCRALHAVADAFVVHEPAEDLPGAVYLRQGIPDWPQATAPGVLQTQRRPVVGSIGFPFPWKNYDLLAEASALAGWALLLIAPNATPEQVRHWQALNPRSYILTSFVPRGEALVLLAGCDATTFLYANANTGTSAAIRQGIAARKPVLASSVTACRQFRDLALDPVGQAAITWLQDLSVQGVADALSQVFPMTYDPRVVRLAHQDSWASAGRCYAQILREGR